MLKTRKELRDGYKQTTTPAGIYQIRNLTNGKLFLGSALNLPGIINSNKFQLKSGAHPNKVLQTDWNEFGSDDFAFEIIDVLEQGEDVGHDYREELAVLLDMWLEKLMPYGMRGYNVPRKT